LGPDIRILMCADSNSLTVQLRFYASAEYSAVRVEIGYLGRDRECHPFVQAVSRTKALFYVEVCLIKRFDGVNPGVVSEHIVE